MLAYFAGRTFYTKKCEDIMKKERLTESISLWPSSNGELIRLNESQMEAMHKALREPFQLIQGPPGIRDWLHAYYNQCIIYARYW